jgi:hypothetical protein
MIQRPKWWNSPFLFLGWIIFSCIVVNMVVQIPNTVGGGAAVMVVILVLAVILHATFQFYMAKRQKRRDDKSDSPN